MVLKRCSSIDPFLGLQSRFGDKPLKFSSSLSPKRDRSPKMVESTHVPCFVSSVILAQHEQYCVVFVFAFSTRAPQVPQEPNAMPLTPGGAPLFFCLHPTSKPPPIRSPCYNRAKLAIPLLSFIRFSSMVFNMNV